MGVYKLLKMVVVLQDGATKRDKTSFCFFKSHHQYHYRLLYNFLLNVNLTDCFILTFNLQMAKPTSTLKKVIMYHVHAYLLSCCVGDSENVGKTCRNLIYWPDLEDIQKGRFPISILESHWCLKIENSYEHQKYETTKRASSCLAFDTLLGNKSLQCSCLWVLWVSKVQDLCTHTHKYINESLFWNEPLNAPRTVLNRLCLHSFHLGNLLLFQLEDNVFWTAHGLRCT